MREGINSPELASPAGPFSHVVKAGGLLYISGQIAQNPQTGHLVEGNVVEQTTQILQNLSAVLKVVHRDFSHVVKVNVFLTDMNDFAAMNAVYATYFDAPYPARSTIAVKALPLGARVEMECVATAETGGLRDQ
jgi:2-iminobutanoate/2-iminopropanoate deaminase